MDVLTEVVTPAVFFDEKLSSFLLCRMVLLSLEHGNTDASSFAYVWFAVVARSGFGNYKDAFRFGRLGYELVEKRGLRSYEARTLMSFGNLVIPTAKHALEGRDMVRRAFDAAYRNGDLTFAAYSWNQLITNFLAVGDPLTEALAEGEKGLAFAEKAHFGLVVDLLTAQVQLIRTLRGLTPKFGCFNDDHFDELEFERHLASNPVLADPEFGYWALKVQARYLSLDYDAAVHASAKAQPLLWSAPSLLEPSAFRFYSALSHAFAWDSAAPDKKQEHLEALAAHHKQLETWAEHCPANFENRVALTGAEIARIEGRLLDAEGLYEKAMRSAHANGFIHNEAVAYEVAARFYAVRGFDKIADAYLQEARYCYLRWGAEGKVRQLDELYPHLRKQEPTRGTSSTTVAPGELLDLATVIKVSQAVSGEIVLEKLIDGVMRAAIEHAGAERGLLILARGDDLRIVAEATTGGTDVTVHLRDASVSAVVLPQSVIRYVMRTREDVILDDATEGNPFSADSYIVQHRARSIVCLPLVNQGRLNGAIYLDNNLAARVFTSDRITLLKVLASQAAISLENTRLYRDLENREAKIRRLVDANILGITTWNVEGAILASNEAFLRMVQYDHDDVAAGRVSWRDMTPADWRERVERALAKVMQTGSVQPFESELFRKDGSRLPVLLAGALFEEGGNEGVAFTLDLSEQKRTEAERERLRQELARLAHLNRVSTLGELTASLTHEINQPMGAAVTNAQACLRFLNRDQPDVPEAREAALEMVRDATRAADIIDRVRSLYRKGSSKLEMVDVNEVIREMVVMLRNEANRYSVTIRTELDETVPQVIADRVQLQQVLLNIMLNGIEAMRDMTGELSIKSQLAENGQLMISVSDTGLGLPTGKDTEIFNAFFTTKSQGTGLGLAITRSIVESLGGRVWAIGNTPRGATFQFTLPAKMAAHA
jgi:PAS domain S-box-containing protein